MVIDVNEKRLVTLDQLREFSTPTQDVVFQECEQDDERYRCVGRLEKAYRAPKHGFVRRFTEADVALGRTDSLHNTRSGPATRYLMAWAPTVYATTVCAVGDDLGRPSVQPTPATRLYRAPSAVHQDPANGGFQLASAVLGHPTGDRASFA
jgi:hypothetical protein